MNLVSYKYVNEQYVDDGWRKENLESSVVLYKLNDFGFIKINSDSVSHIVQEKLIDVCVSDMILDDFLCFAFKNKICLTEKTRKLENFVKTTNRKYWPDTEIYELNHNDYGLDGYSLIFKSIKFNYVTMNNNCTILVMI